MAYPRLIAAVVICLFLSLAAATPVLAAEVWTTAPKTRGQICVILADGETLISAAWSGPLVGGKAEGSGRLIYTYKNKDGKETTAAADAAMKAGKLDGRASIKWSDGDAYVGFYKEGLREGKGVFLFADGRSYDGDWKKSKMDGKGLYKFANGEAYEGDFVAGAREGKGVYRWPSGQVYEGDWLGDKESGKGRIKYATGETYEGDFVAGAREGKGVLHWSDGTVYEGDWLGDLMEGKGVFKYTDGQVYEGDFSKGQRHGQGVLRDAAGKIVYEGAWKDDQPYGGPPKLDKILGIPWEASESETQKIMLARHGTILNGVFGGPGYKWHTYLGSANKEPARIQVQFYQGKMFCVEIDLFYSEDQIMNKFQAIKSELSQHYGPPYSEQGKHLDSKAYWDLGGGYSAAVIIVNRSAFMSREYTLPDFMRKPFSATISYWHRATWDQVNKEANQKAANDR